MLSWSQPADCAPPGRRRGRSAPAQISDQPTESPLSWKGGPLRLRRCDLPKQSRNHHVPSADAGVRVVSDHLLLLVLLMLSGRAVTEGEQFGNRRSLGTECTGVQRTLRDTFF